MSLVDRIKNQVKRSGVNKSKLVYFKSGEKVRVRFLDDMDEGMSIPFHDSFAEGINVPCQEVFGKDCKYCDDESLRTRDQFIWCVWDYEAKEVKLLMAPVNNCSPVPLLVGMYDAYGTLSDRDYVITKNGQGTTTTYTVVPMDKVKFKNSKAKPFSEETILKIIGKAFPDDSDDDEDDEDVIKSTKRKTAKSKKRAVDDYDEDEYDDYDEDDEDGYDDEEELDYYEMSAKELYSLCKERDIEAPPKKKKSFYIDRLEAADNAEAGEDEDEW